MPGAISLISCGGFRSELLAQYAFSSWGAVVATPNSQDHGIDLYCNLVEAVGKRALARSSYTVQVKSNMAPWEFDGREAVRWLIEHPLPLFLCVVDKLQIKLRVYHTIPRFWVWAFGKEWESLRLRPTVETKGERIQWEGETEFSLGAPILDFGIEDLLDDQFRRNAAKVLETWIGVDNENLTRVRTGILNFLMPYKYSTNEPPHDSHTAHYSNIKEKASDEQYEAALPFVSDALDFIGGELHKRGDLEGAAKALLLHLHLFPDKLHPYLNEIDAALTPAGVTGVVSPKPGCTRGHIGIGRVEKLVYEAVKEASRATPRNEQG